MCVHIISLDLSPTLPVLVPVMDDGRGILYGHMGLQSRLFVFPGIFETLVLIINGICFSGYALRFQ